MSFDVGIKELHLVLSRPVLAWKKAENSAAAKFAVDALREGIGNLARMDCLLGLVGNRALLVRLRRTTKKDCHGLRWSTKRSGRMTTCGLLVQNRLLASMSLLGGSWSLRLVRNDCWGGQNRGAAQVVLLDDWHFGSLGIQNGGAGAMVLLGGRWNLRLVRIDRWSQRTGRAEEVVLLDSRHRGSLGFQTKGAAALVLLRGSRHLLLLRNEGWGHQTGRAAAVVLRLNNWHRRLVRNDGTRACDTRAAHLVFRRL